MTTNRDGFRAEDGAQVPAERIAAAVTAGSFIYSDGATQSFDPGGATRYTEHGRETAGTWSIDEDGHFSSFWPPDYRASYEVRWVVEKGHVVGLRFSDVVSGAHFDGRYH
ncbi:hypothetical protein [Streptomyces sp. NRRL F-5126]|uniref:hypothetical protein n=1 Tax=Streptomyces sp. NRRL F-5126 TaxID=1463857 RepID=UPI0004C829D1|nr:hypothetical protein [Streptomyces sp. NRRL F-5126]